MKRNVLSRMVVLFVVLTTFTSVAAAQSFDPVFNWIKRFQQGEDVELIISIQADKFSVLREEVTSLDKATFDKLLASSKPKHIRLKMKRDVEYIVYDMDEELRLEELLSSSSSGTGGTLPWAKGTHVPIATYPITRWGEFLKATLNHGLLKYEETRIAEQETKNITLYFKRVGPGSFKYGTKSLTFSDTFYQFMKLPEGHEPVSGSEGFVVIVHDPHWSRSGRVQLIPGLKALIDTNNQNQYIFLVEGSYTDTSRIIGFNTLDKVIDRTRARRPSEPFVYSLLSRYLIDCPLAYRLIHDRTVPALAIDDPAFFKTGQRDTAHLSRRKVHNAIVNVLKALDTLKLSDSDSKQLTSALVFAVTYNLAEVTAISGQGLVVYFNKMAETLKTVVLVAKALKEGEPTLKLDEDIATLESEIRACGVEAKIYGDALKRDNKMAQLISEHAGWAKTRVPIAFIGSFHTEGITSQLRARKIGYVVIEPRFSDLASSQEQAEFDRYIYPDTREKYIKDSTGQDKGPVLPHITEVQRYYVPFIERESRNITRRELASEQSFRQVPAKEIDYNSFHEAVKANGVLSGVRAELGSIGGGNDPPPGGNAFAFFEPGDGGREPRFVVVDPRDSRWNPKNSTARYNYLREVALVPPAQEESVTLLGRATFYQDRESKVVFASYFEPKNRRFYLLEGDKAIDVFNYLTPPTPQKDQDIRIHLRLSELERLNRQRMKRDGKSRARNEKSE